MCREHAETGDDSRHQCPNGQNLFVRGTFYLLLATAIFTGWYAFTARDTEHRQLRAYLIVQNARFARDDAGNLQYGRDTGGGFKELLVLYDVLNEGATPAYNVERNVGITEPFFHKSLEITHTEGTAAYISKQETFKIRTTGFNSNQIDEIMTGKYQFIFLGKITYEDVFGDKWPTNFCFLYAPHPIEPAFDYCPRSNENDRLNYAR